MLFMIDGNSDSKQLGVLTPTTKLQPRPMRRVYCNFSLQAFAFDFWPKLKEGQNNTY